MRLKIDWTWKDESQAARLPLVKRVLPDGSRCAASVFQLAAMVADCSILQID